MKNIAVAISVACASGAAYLWHHPIELGSHYVVMSQKLAPLAFVSAVGLLAAVVLAVEAIRAWWRRL